MLRSEMQKKTGLTRKAIEYYEERGLICPKKSPNGYREYSEEDLEVLSKVSMLRKVGLTINEIEEYLNSGMGALSCALRRKQHGLEVDIRRKNVLEMILKGAGQEEISEKLDRLEKEETIYQKLERAFPGYFGQMLFISYQPFLQENLREGSEHAYEEYVNFLDELPVFELSEEEKNYIEKISSPIDLSMMKDFNQGRIQAVEAADKWWDENEDIIKQYEEMKKSKEYLESPIEGIKTKIFEYMQKNRYYEIAIPLIRSFSKSYDDYYKKLLEAGEKYKQRMEAK